MIGRSLIERVQNFRRFTGPEYGWMWPFRRAVAGWYDSVIAQLRERAA